LHNLEPPFNEGGVPLIVVISIKKKVGIRKKRRVQSLVFGGGRKRFTKPWGDTWGTTVWVAKNEGVEGPKGELEVGGGKKEGQAPIRNSRASKKAECTKK